MSGDLPDVQSAHHTDHGATQLLATRRNGMAIIQVKVIEGVFTAPQKREMIERLTDVMVEIEGENMRQAIWCVIDEVASDEWGVGGKTLTADDVKALARAEVTR
jgi:4-oxalocrotonate tautomerase